jgi:CRISPR/Cas system-associated exonuclease Cas4 (RecB family)
MRIFEHVKLSQLQFDLKAETTDIGRLYTTPEGNRYKSITTVLSHYGKQGIYEWRKAVGEEYANEVSRKAANRGTKVHKVCEDYLNNEIPELKMQLMMPDLKELFFKIKPIIDDNVGKVYTQEQALYSDSLRIAGRVDLIAEWNGKLSVIDFKTSTKQKEEENIQNYFMQCTAYALMFSERTGIWIDDIVVLIATEEGPPQVFERQIHDYRQPLIEMIDKYA